MLRLEDQSDSPINILESVAEEHLVVKVLRLGTTSKWPSSKDILIWNAPPLKSNKSLWSQSPVESKLMLISDQKKHDLWKYYSSLNYILLVQIKIY